MVYGVFKIQQDYISQYQCVNRDKPIAQCNGSCVLTERLAEPLNDLPSNDSEPILVQIKIDFLLDDVEELTRASFFEQHQSGFIHNQELQGFLSLVLQPPQTV